MVRVERRGKIARLHPLHHHQVHKAGHTHQRNVNWTDNDRVKSDIKL